MTSTTAKVRFSQDDPPHEVSDGMLLVEYLQNLAAKCRPELPTIVDVYVHGYEVLVGLGLPESFVHFERESGEPPYLVTVGEYAGEDAVAFYLHGVHHTEIPRRQLINTAEALRIVREFFETGVRSTSVEWEEI